MKANHVFKHCPSPYSCQKCNRCHNTLLHLDTGTFKGNGTLGTIPGLQPHGSTPNTKETTHVSTSLVNYLETPEATTSGPVLMMTAHVVSPAASLHLAILLVVHVCCNQRPVSCPSGHLPCFQLASLLNKFQLAMQVH